MFSKKATKNYKIFTVDLTLTKGQIILKGLFGVLEFSQKRTNKFVVVVKTNSLGEFEDAKSPFEII